MIIFKDMTSKDILFHSLYKLKKVILVPEKKKEKKTITKKHVNITIFTPQFMLVTHLSHARQSQLRKPLAKCSFASRRS